MQLAVTVDEMKNYLRVDFEDDDALIGDLIRQGQQICMDVARITDEDEFEDLQGTKIAVQYAAAYLYEHREEADHHQLVMDLRAYLLQEGVSDPPEQAELIYRLRNTGDTGSLLAEPFWSVTAGGKEYTLSAVTGQALQNVEIA